MGKILKLNALLMVVLSLSMCKPTHTVVTQTVRDTINTTTIERIEVPVSHTVTVEQPCDSLGILKQFKQTFKTEHATVTVSNHNGNIVAKINLDSVKQVWSSQYEGKTEFKEVRVPFEVPTPFIPKWFWSVLIVLVVYVAYRIARIFVPVIRWLPY